MPITHNFFIFSSFRPCTVFFLRSILQKHWSCVCVCSYHRPECLVTTIRVVTMGIRAPPPTPKVIQTTSHTTRATARRGKMCETLHKRTSADRGDLACPLSPVLVCNWLTVKSHFCCQPREVVSSIKTSTVSVFLSSFSGWQATISSRRKRTKKKEELL